MKKIIILSAYHADSHRYWAEGLMSQFPEYEWDYCHLPPRFFSWRIRGNPLSFLEAYPHIKTTDYDLVIATSMVDLATLKSLVPRLAAVPSMVYFHENQFDYPLSGRQHDSVEPKMVNLYSALVADRIVFNSVYNQETFLAGVDELLIKMPDYKPVILSENLFLKSSVLPVPLVPPEIQEPGSVKSGNRPHLVWNHRWEYDKGPRFLHAIIKLLADRGVELDISIIGQQFRKYPVEFDEIKKIILDCESLELLHFGFIDLKSDYHNCLGAADIVLSTAVHDFQGLSVLEAVARGCKPVLPDALVYPELFPMKYRYEFNSENLESTAQAAIDCILLMIKSHEDREEISSMVNDLFWNNMRETYCELLEQYLGHHSSLSK